MSEATVCVNLTGVPETMLWTLYDRASEAMRPHGHLVDPHCVAIFRALDYDFIANFGPSSGRFAIRAACIDSVVRRWLRRYPDGFVVSLGEGLETQALRIDNGRMRWLSVDLPEAIRIRERFIQPTERFRHVAASALDPVWMDQIDARANVLVVAQGLLMYLQPDQVRELLIAIGRRFPGADLVFDVVPRSLSQATLRGHQQTRSYLLPPMPWGLARDEVRPTLRAWCPDLTRIRLLRYRFPSGRPAWVDDVLDMMLPSRNDRASLVWATYRATPP